ncbi:CBO0543 family protein [Bacillus sp. DTU_2020_1000418_1_SI_GHA_SEK_038]|uniref:CBO0543 family protein n=1 Tax=Bacillus sp. DTU_2020_1000418_1_SI_GHA_SEK_038 TaxID=3077585 RepID=UPI0028EFF0C6|nr:CBO0543 family protein [Bacillus sp. DTU_2020_1000418_1_SI_GHA_SEK_038]WNS77472.1 CBO0543 family protein [Bacillus sp. DTU_2020_1000418_1_SI_GHA_SEK_038]
MTIAKHLKGLSSQQLQKRPFFYEIKKMVPAILLASLIGTHLDLFFVGMGVYSFPKRWLPEVFSINIVFTLIALPLLVSVYLFLMKRINVWKKAGLIFVISLFAACAEKFAEEMGFFIHEVSWKHSYSFCGYIVFLICVYIFNRINFLSV